MNNLSLTFNSVDVETANADRSTICQIAIVAIRKGVITDEWCSLVNPEDWFDPFNVSIHGIDASQTKSSPTLPELHSSLRQQLADHVVVSHTSFDRIALERGWGKYRLENIPLTWLDSARVVRRAWPERYRRAGWGLKSVATDLSIEFNHHDALEDARAAALVLLAACQEKNLSVSQWLRRSQQPISPRARSRSKTISRQGNEQGPLFGETIAFTGALDISRSAAADLASEAGCNVVNGVSRKVTMLVVGVQDKRKLGGYEKSRKHRQAELLIESGSDIQILSELDFKALLPGNTRF